MYVRSHSTHLRLQVFDAETGCRWLDLDEKTERPTPRHARVGAAQPRFLPASDVLQLPVLGADAFLRLVRPRTGETLFATAVDRGGVLSPFVFDAHGRYEGDPAAVSEVMAFRGAPEVEPRHRTDMLLREFLSRPPRRSCP